MAWFDAKENQIRCSDCAADCEEEGESTPCHGCPWQRPELLEANELAFLVYRATRNCRNGEGLDWGAVIHYMQLQELSQQSQLECFAKITAAESAAQAASQAPLKNP